MNEDDWIKKEKTWKIIFFITLLIFIIGCMLYWLITSINPKESNITINKNVFHSEEQWSEECVPMWMLCYFSNQSQTECLQNIMNLTRKGIFKLENPGEWSECVYANMGNKTTYEYQEVDKIFTNWRYSNKVDHQCEEDCWMNVWIKPGLQEECVRENCYMVLKEEITKEWLENNENCECIKKEGKCSNEYWFGYNNYEGYNCELKKTSWNIFGFTRPKNRDKEFHVEPKELWCVEYKCFENYTVGVKK